MSKHAESPRGGHEKIPRLNAVASTIVRNEYLPQVGDSRYLGQQRIVGMYPEAFAAPSLTTPSIAAVAMAGQRQGEQLLANTIGTGATQGAVRQTPAPYESWPGAYMPDNSNEGTFDASVADAELHDPRNQAGFEDLHHTAPIDPIPAQAEQQAFIKDVTQDIANIDQLANGANSVQAGMGTEN